MSDHKIIDKLNSFKAELEKKNNGDISASKKELYDGQIVEIDILLDKVQYIKKGTSANWDQIYENFMNLFELIRKADTFQELIFSLYRSRLYKEFDEIDLLYEKSEEQIAKEERNLRKRSLERTNNSNLSLEF